MTTRFSIKWLRECLESPGKISPEGRLQLILAAIQAAGVGDGLSLSKYLEQHGITPDQISAVASQGTLLQEMNKTGHLLAYNFGPEIDTCAEIAEAILVKCRWRTSFLAEIVIVDWNGDEAKAIRIVDGCQKIEELRIALKDLPRIHEGKSAGQRKVRPVT